MKNPTEVFPVCMTPRKGGVVLLFLACVAGGLPRHVPNVFGMGVVGG
jgi:hypothetical protein